MTATDGAANVRALRLRVCKLAADGSKLVGTTSSYTTDVLVEIQSTPVYQDSAEVAEENGTGLICVTLSPQRSLKRHDLQVTVCDPDEQLEEIMAGGTVLLSAGAPIGYSAPAVGTQAQPNGISIEAWSLAVVNGAQAATNPYRRYLWPRARLYRDPQTLDVGASRPVFTGFAEENPNYGTGPFADWAYNSSRIIQRIRTGTLPASGRDYVAVT